MADNDDKGLLGKATDEIGKAAAKHAAKAAFDEASRRAKQAIEGVVGSAESWVGQEAASAEARREASGLPDTEVGEHWTDALAEEGKAAFERARNPTLVDDETDEDEEDAAQAEREARQRAAAERKAKAREELARMKAALHASDDPLLAEARRTRTAVPVAEPEPAALDTLDAELEAMAAAAAVDAGSVVPEDEVEEPVSDEVVEAIEDPALAILARARAARAAASDDPEAVLAEPELASEPPPAEDPALAALAAAQAARGAMQVSHSASEDRARAEARARIEAITEQAWETPTPTAPSLDFGAAPASSDPLAEAEASLAQAHAARVRAGTTTDPMEAARAAAKARIAAITAAAAEEAERTRSDAFLGMDADPMARARAALESAAGARGTDAVDRARNLARARAQLREGKHRKSTEELAREALEAFADADTPAEDITAAALAASEAQADRQRAIAEKARRDAEAYAAAMQRRAEEAKADVEARIAGRTAFATAGGSPEERTAAALEAAAAARAQARGGHPAQEAERRIELERLKRARDARDGTETPPKPPKSDLLGATLVPGTTEPSDPSPGDQEDESDPLPDRKL